MKEYYYTGKNGVVNRYHYTDKSGTHYIIDKTGYPAHPWNCYEVSKNGRFETWICAGKTKRELLAGIDR